MSEPGHAPQAGFETATAGPRGFLLLVAGMLCFFVFAAVDPLLGAGLLVLLATIALPIGVHWLPVRAAFVVTRYVPFLVLWLGVAVAYLRLMQVLGHVIEPQSALRELLTGERSAWQLVQKLFLVVVLAPLAEEILFRGYLFTAIGSVAPMWATQLVTATLFGLVHGLGHALPIGLLSLFFGYLRQRYQSLTPSMLAHALHNGFTVALMLTWPELLDLFYNR